MGVTKESDTTEWQNKSVSHKDPGKAWAGHQAKGEYARHLTGEKSWRNSEMLYVNCQGRKD